MSIVEHLDKNNLHHAYLIEGSREQVVPQILDFLGDIGVEIVSNPDLSVMALDTFKIDDARNLKSYANQMADALAKKVYIISVNNILLEAQNSLLKLFEEPINNTHFFFVTPDTNSLLKTFVSRFYVIRPKSDIGLELASAEKFVGLPLQKRLDYIKDLLVEAEDEDEDGNEVMVLNSSRSKAIKFLNSLEAFLHKQSLSKGIFDTNHKTIFEHIFKVRQGLRFPGSSTKMLLESVALLIPANIK